MPIDARLMWSFARSHLRSARRAVRPRPATAASRFVPVMHKDYELRLLRPADSSGWTAAMRANEHRMRPWWPEVDDWEKSTDAVAFADHYRAWQGRRRRGAGFPLVVVGPSGVLGEVTTWNLDRGGTTGETGIWLFPRISKRDFMPLWAGYFDNLFGNLGLDRVVSPVATGNAGPVRLIHEIGGREVAVIPQAGTAGGAVVDHRLFALDRERWLEVRPTLFAATPWMRVAESLPRLS